MEFRLLMKNPKLPKQNIVLLGVGHTNAHILKKWGMKPIPRTQLICISNFPNVTYSGMLPGVLAGQYTNDQMQIDLVRACAANQARLILDKVTNVDFDRNVIQFEGRPELKYDQLSIGVGSQPNFHGVTMDSPNVVPIKPMQTFLDRLNQKIDDHDSTDPIRVSIVGAGIGGVEIAFCLVNHLKTKLGDSNRFEISIVNSGEKLAPGVNPNTEQKIRTELEQKQIKVITGQRVESIDGNSITTQGGEAWRADIVLWATSAIAPELVNRLDLEKDDRGFILTQPTLQTLSYPNVYAVGDTGTLRTNPTTKAGVYAVRQGPILWENLQRTIRRESLKHFKPQSGFLKLVNKGDGTAIGEYFGRTFEGPWVWKLKDRIDSKFMSMYTKYKPMEMKPSTEENEMRCLGCGGKVGGSVLKKLIKRLNVQKSEHVVLGLDNPDDAAIVKASSNNEVTVTTDFFAAPFDDPYRVGRIAALNSTSDVYAMGAKPVAALAMITVPPGRADQQEELLYELLAGSLEELDSMGCTLAGGHTIEGDTMTIGFTIIAHQEQNAATKSNLKPGCDLIMTKRLGVGCLLAALMQAKCKGEWYPSLMENMMHNNMHAAKIGFQIGVESLTDVTGFGLAGHLFEMLRASGLSAELFMDEIQLLPGAKDVLESGIESTLAPDNAWVKPWIDHDSSSLEKAKIDALFDPQTNGGMLMAITPDKSERLLESLANNQIFAKRIGVTVAREGDESRLKLR